MQIKNILHLIAISTSLSILLGGCQSQPYKATAASKTQSSERRVTIEEKRRKNIHTCETNSVLIPADKQLSTSNWSHIYRNCPDSGVAAYNHALNLLENNDIQAARRVIETAIDSQPDFEPLQALQRQIDSPFTEVAQIANKKLQAWLRRPSKVKEFKRSVPKKEALPPLPTLVKGEFESSTMFKARVAKAKDDRERRVKQVESRYRLEVMAFNRAVNAYNTELEKENSERRARIPELKRVFLGEAMAKVFGEPRFVDPVYDADRELFNARLVSSKDNFDKRVSIRVPLTQAKGFKASIGQVEPLLDFDIVADRIKLTQIHARYHNHPYIAQLTEEIYESLPVSVQLTEVEMPQSAGISLMIPEQPNTQQMLAKNAQHFQGALRFEDDPKLAKQRQELAELQRKKREVQLRQLKERERARLQAQIDRNRQELASLGGKAGDEYKGLKMTHAWKFKPASSANPDMVAVIMGNRNYGKGIPLVHYAHNDAKAVKQFLADSYGLAQENILYEEDATKGVMDGIFQKRLGNRVTQGQTSVFVYFSGHGMPVGDDARLLPSDARPENAEINGYSRDELLQQLARLNAKSLTIVLDSCYSGSSKSGKALQPVKAIMAEPKRVQVPDNSVIITAASGKQTAYMDDQTGHSLLTFYLLKGLSGEADEDQNNQIDTNELKHYLSSEVNRMALRLHDQRQNPQVKGEQRVLIEY